MLQDLFMLISHAPLSRKDGLTSNHALDKAHSLRAVFFHVLLVRVGIMTVAAVRVCGVAIRFDLASGRAVEAPWASSKLGNFSLRNIEAIDGVLLAPGSSRRCMEAQQHSAGRP